jgi:hypothetical protein
MSSENFLSILESREASFTSESDLHKVLLSLLCETETKPAIEVVFQWYKDLQTVTYVHLKTFLDALEKVDLQTLRNLNEYAQLNDQGIGMLQSLLFFFQDRKNNFSPYKILEDEAI